MLTVSAIFLIRLCLTVCIPSAVLPACLTVSVCCNASASNPAALRLDAFALEPVLSYQFYSSPVCMLRISAAVDHRNVVRVLLLSRTHFSLAICAWQMQANSHVTCAESRSPSDNPRIQ